MGNITGVIKHLKYGKKDFYILDTEIDMIRFLASGDKIIDIADRYDVCVDSIRKHLHKIMDML